MRQLLFLISCFFATLVNAQQFRYDNVQFTTVYAEDLCKALKDNPNAVLLDVRSKGEYEDTSASLALNLGRFKNAINISVAELDKRWHELEQYKTTPVFIYCSHSQRSRRAAHLLADSGFTRIYNINGGMTQLLKMSTEMPSCFSRLYETNTRYKILSPAQVMEQSKKKIPWLIIDLRADSVYQGISRIEKRNAMGRLEPSINVLYSHLEGSLSKMRIGSPILLVDDFGSESPLAAELLLNIGITDVSILLNGMEGWLTYNTSEKTNNPFNWKMPSEYTLISGTEFDRMARENIVSIVDVRPADHYHNKSKNAWENIGRVQNAINIPVARINEPGTPLPVVKDQPVILYTYNNHEEVYEAASKMKAKGYSKIYILVGGIWNLRWASHNLKNKEELAKWVVGVPEENQ